VGNDISKNISLYCKGEVSSLVGLWFNFYFPSLFNASVLHVKGLLCRMGYMTSRMRWRLSPLEISLETAHPGMLKSRVRMG